MSAFEIATSLALGIGLAAATGFRIFLPMLVMSGAANLGYLELGENFAFLATATALAVLAVAAVAEVLAYYVPAVDNLLDTIATPAAFVAGTLVAAATFTDLPPLIKWSAAIIAGGGIAGITQTLSAVLRGHSTLFTGGLGNWVVATGELLGALGVSLLALAAPFLALTAAVAILIAGLALWRRLRRDRANVSDTG
jgi:hypothetical protein